MTRIIGVLTDVVIIGLPIAKYFGGVSCSWLAAFLPVIVLLAVGVGIGIGENKARGRISL